MNQSDKIIEIIENNSICSMENKNLIKKYIQQSINKKKSITFYNWECPPRIISQDKFGDVYINYDVDYDKIFRGQKLDKYTELPRVVEEKEREIRQLELLKSLGLSFRFVKLIADTNAYYITPQSLNIVGKRKTRKIFKDFKRRIRQILREEYPFSTSVYLFSDLIKEFREIYDNSFFEAVELIKNNKIGLVSERIWQEQLKRTKDHIGIDDKNTTGLYKDFSQRVIATYAAEGTIFNLLSQIDKFSNCVWLNIEEVDNRIIAITNCLRKKRGIEKLPMIFFK